MLTTRPSHLVYDTDIDAAADLADGVYLESELPAILVDANGFPRNMIILGPLDGEHQRGVDLVPLLSAAGADADTATIIIHRVSAVVTKLGDSEPLAYRFEKLYTITDLVASTQTFAIGDVHETRAYRGIDTVPTPTKTARATLLETQTGTAIGVHSPADNTPGLISLPDLDGAYAVAIEATVGGSGAFNCLAEIKT